MRKLLLLLGVLVINVLYAQKLDSVVATYKQTTKDLIKKNWGEYFKEEITMPIFRQNAKDVFSLRFDSYGLIYPENDLFSEVSLKMMEGNGQRGTRLTKYSFFHIFEWYSNALESSIKQMHGADSVFYADLIRKVKTEGIGVEAFNALWENYHIQKTIKRFSDKTLGYSRIVIFIHGYNVPYSLAALQFDFMINRFGLNDGNTLFVPVYWPSNADKRCEIGERSVNFKDKISLSNGWKFLFYSNQAYFAGLSLRRFLGSIDVSKKIKMISHSLGATVSTTALINPDNKLQGEATTAVNSQLIKKMRNIHVPDRKIDMFLSAPAIPGELTFENMADADCHNFRIWSAWNKNDKVLNKRFLGIVNIGPHRLSNTTLGLNHKDDAEKAKLIVHRKCGDRFEHRKVSCQKSHDIFSYMEQKNYRIFLTEFFNK